MPSFFSQKKSPIVILIQDLYRRCQAEINIELLSNNDGLTKTTLFSRKKREALFIKDNYRNNKLNPSFDIHTRLNLLTQFCTKITRSLNDKRISRDEAKEAVKLLVSWCRECYPGETDINFFGRHGLSLESIQYFTCELISNFSCNGAANDLKGGVAEWLTPVKCR